MEFRFVVDGGARRIWLNRVFGSMFAAVAFVSGIWIIVGALTVGADKSLVIFGAIFLAVAAVVVSSWWRLAFEVSIADGQVGWRGIWSSGTAPLESLRAIQPARWQGAVLTFEFSHHSGF